MARKSIKLLICGLILCAVENIPALCQETSKPNSLPEQLPVYIVDFNQDLRRADVAREIGDLGAFTSGLIHLRLLEISSVTVHRVQTTPVCGEAVSPSPDQSQSTRTQAAPSGDFYIVHGSIETHLPDFVLNYFVDKCENRKLLKVFQDTQPFTLDHALEEITSSAHAIAFKIEKAIPPTQVAVEPFSGDSDQQDQKDIRTTARNEVVQAVLQSSDYKVVDTSGYIVGGQITFLKDARAIRIFPNATAIRADIHINAHGKTYPLKQVTGSSDQLKKFYADVAEEVVRNLPQVLLAEHLQLPDVVNHMKSDALLTQANQLLSQCSDTDRDCPSAQDAIKLLSVVTQQDPRAWKVFVTLGRAQMRAGKNVDAVSSLVKANDLIKADNQSGGHISTQDQVEALSLLGNSYRNIADYREAEATYDEALRIDSSLPQLYGSKALALQFDNKRPQALDAIIQGLKISGQAATSQPLHESAKGVIHALQPGEFDGSEASLDKAFGQGVPVANEYALLVALKWEHIFDVSWTPESRAKARIDLKKALDRGPTDPAVLVTAYGDAARAELVDGNQQHLMDLVHQAEKQPADQIPPFLRAWIQRIQAHSEIDSGDYSKAYDAAEVAYHIYPSDDASYLLADSTLLLTQCKEWALVLGQKEDGLKQCKRDFLIRDDERKGSVSLTADQARSLKESYQQAADVAAPLVAKRYQDGDGVLLRANHALGQDKKTRDLFLGFVQQDPKDASAVDILLYVCSQYLFDFDCAFLAAQKIAGGLHANDPTAASDYLNVAEAAVLKGDNKAATDWLASAGQPQTMKPRDAVLFYIYRLWVAMSTGQTGEFKTDFDAWREATKQFRDSKEDLNWVFTGAKKALDRSKTQMGAGKTELLLSMMAASENDTSTLPSWPQSGIL
jgi:tetratricopeptide (TPR) repeat protein